MMENYEGYNSSMFLYFSKVYKIKKSTKGWYRCNCDLCGGSYTFGVNFTHSRVKCFKCDYKSSIIKYLTQTISGVETYYEVIAFLKEGYYSTKLLKEFKEEKRVRKKVELPAGFKLLSIGGDYIAKKARGFMKKRGFNILDLSMKGVGYCTEGKYIGSIIYPYYRQGELVYYSDRRFLMGFGRKFDNPTVKDFGVGKEEIFYNWDALYLYKTIYLVESVSNALTLGDRAISSGGKTLSDFQMGEIIKSPVENVVIILDPDALKEAIQLAIRLSRFKRVKLVHWDGNKDVNSLGKRETLKHIKTTEYKKINYFLSYKMKFTYETGKLYTYN